MVEAILSDCLLVGRRGSWVPRLWARGLQLKEKTDIIIVKQETRKTSGLYLGMSTLPLRHCDDRFLFLSQSRTKFILGSQYRVLGHNIFHQLTSAMGTRA